jgi:hypothetical protein
MGVLLRCVRRLIGQSDGIRPSGVRGVDHEASQGGACEMAGKRTLIKGRPDVNDVSRTLRTGGRATTDGRSRPSPSVPTEYALVATRSQNEALRVVGRPRVERLMRQKGLQGHPRSRAAAGVDRPDRPSVRSEWAGAERQRSDRVCRGVKLRPPINVVRDAPLPYVYSFRC